MSQEPCIGPVADNLVILRRQRRRSRVYIGIHAFLVGMLFGPPWPGSKLEILWLVIGFLNLGMIFWHIRLMRKANRIIRHSEMFLALVESVETNGADHPRSVLLVDQLQAYIDRK